MHSHCSTCGSDFYDKVVEKCPKCGGLCAHLTDRDVQFVEHEARCMTVGWFDGMGIWGPRNKNFADSAK